MNYFILLLTLLLGLPAAARELPLRVMTLEECIDSAMASNRQIAASMLQVERAGILKGTAFNPPMTEVLLKQETTGGGGPENGVAFSQDFEFPSVYVQRHRQLSAMGRLEESRLGVLMADVERKVSEAYQSMLYYRDMLRLNEGMDSVYVEFCRVASARFENGETSALELMNAERMREKNAMERMALNIEYANALADMKTLTGVCCDILPADESLEPLPYINAESFDFDATLRGRMARKEVEVADREITLARNEFLPSLRIGATVQALIKSFNPYHIERLRFRPGNFMGFEVGLNVPLFFGAQTARLKAARAERDIRLLDMASADMEASNEMNNLQARITALSARLQEYREVSLPRAGEIKRIAGVSYELGEIDYLEFIANMETFFSTWRDYADCVREYNLSVINQKYLTK